MLANSLKVRRTLAVLMLAGAGLNSHLAAGQSEVADCYDRVLAMCGEALEDANWLEKVGIGVLCTGMLTGCVAEVL